MSQESTPPADFLTLVMPLTARPGLTNADFYDYWLNAHVTLPARFPGITSIWLHPVSFGDATWPRPAGGQSPAAARGRVPGCARGRVRRRGRAGRIPGRQQGPDGRRRQLP